MYDVIIIGGGPGGVAAGVYASRKKMKSMLITDSFGGQSLNSAGIENWIGTNVISGYDLAKSLEAHLRAQKNIDIVDNDLVSAITKKDDGTFSLTTKSGKNFDTKYILIASGSRRKRLGVPGEDEYDGKGVVFCTTCDAPLFDGKTTLVVGGGNSALESVEDLIPYSPKIYVMVRGDAFRGDPVTQEKVKAHPQVTVMWNTTVQEVRGNKFVTGVRYKDEQTGEQKELAVDGVFVEVGLLPNSEFVRGLVDIDSYGRIKVNHQTQETSLPGIWAVGDVSDGLYQQNNISVGEGVTALLNIYDRVKKG